MSRDVLRHRTPGADDGSVADRHRGHELDVRADEDARRRCRVVLGEAVVVAGDDAGADVRLLADRAVAEVGEVVRLGALRQDAPSSSRRSCRRGPSGRGSVPSRSRANGPTTAPSPTTASLDDAVGPDGDVRSRRRSRSTHPCPIREPAPTRSSREAYANGSTTSGARTTPSSSVIVSGRISVAPPAIAASVARAEEGVDVGELGPRVDPEHLVRDRPRRGRSPAAPTPPPWRGRR